MTKRREMVKKFIEKIVDNLPTYIEKYHYEDQTLLNEFRKMVEICGKETDRYEIKAKKKVQSNTKEKAKLKTEPEQELGSPRTVLSKKIEFHIQLWRDHEDYFELPFLWFLVSFFGYANLVLSVSSFHSDEFFEYLLQYLRGDSKVKGAFQLVRNETPLSDIAWEQLQYACVKMFPLSSEELDILKIICVDNSETGIRSVNQVRLKKLIQYYHNENNIRVDTTRFFKLLDGTWNLFFNDQSFGIESIYIHFQVVPKEDRIPQIADIIKIHEPQNTTFAYSRFFSVRSEKNTYIGLIMIPTSTLPNLIKYLHSLEQQGLILLIDEIYPIKNYQFSTSLGLYTAGEGWGNLTEFQKKKIVTLVNNPHSRTRKKNQRFFITPMFQSWHYKQHPLTSQFITLFCTPKISFSYEDLLSKGSNREKNFAKFSQAEIGLLKLLFKKHVLQITFEPIRLIFEFSLDLYWIKIPEEVQYNQLFPILEILPYCKILHTHPSFHFWVYLPPDLVKWIKKDLKWEVIPIKPFYYPRVPELNWYDFKKEHWKVPKDIGDI